MPRWMSRPRRNTATVVEQLDGHTGTLVPGVPTRLYVSELQTHLRSRRSRFRHPRLQIRIPRGSRDLPRRRLRGRPAEPWTRGRFRPQGDARTARYAQGPGLVWPTAPAGYDLARACLMFPHRARSAARRESKPVGPHDPDRRIQANGRQLVEQLRRTQLRLRGRAGCLAAADHRLGEPPVQPNGSRGSWPSARYVHWPI